MARKKKTEEKQKTPEGMRAFNETPDEEIKKDIKIFIDSGVISNTEVIPYTLALLYNSLGEDDKEDVASGICSLSKKLNELYSEAAANKAGTSVEFMFALLYMLANMNSTLMQDEAWMRLSGKGIMCREKFLGMMAKNANQVTKVEDNRGYG